MKTTKPYQTLPNVGANVQHVALFYLSDIVEAHNPLHTGALLTNVYLMPDSLIASTDSLVKLIFKQQLNHLQHTNRQCILPKSRSELHVF